MEGTIRFATEDQFGRFCQILAYKDEHGRQGGEDLSPSSLKLAICEFYPEFISARGAAGAEDLNMEPVNVDQWGSRLLLKDVGRAKIDFPNVAKKNREILTKVEGIWSGLAK